MAEIVAFPTEGLSISENEPIDQVAEDCFLLDEGLELLADYRAIPDHDVRASLRALVKSMALQGSRCSG